MRLHTYHGQVQTPHPKKSIHKGVLTNAGKKKNYVL